MPARAASDAVRPVWLAVAGEGAMTTGAEGAVATLTVVLPVLLTVVAVLVTVQVRTSDPGASAEKVIWFVPCPAAMVPPAMVQA